MRWWILILLVGCAAPRSAVVLEGGEGGRDVLLPTVDCGLFFLVRARIEGRGPYTLLLDSGASASHLDPDLDVMRGGKRRVRTIEIGPLRLRNQSVKTSELDHVGEALGQPLDGILGWPAFADLLVTFDYPAREVRVARGSLPTPDGDQVFGCVATSGPYLNMTIGDVSRTVLLDTGSDGGVSFSVLGDEYFEEPPQVVGSVTGYEGSSPKRAGRLRYDLVLGKTVLPRPIVGFTDQISIVGAAVLRDFRVTFDATSARLGLEHFGAPVQ